MSTQQEIIQNYFSTGKLPGLRSLNFINGEWKKPTSGKYMETFDPATGKAVSEFSASNAEDIEEAVVSSQKAFKLWRNFTQAERCKILNRASDITYRNKNFLSVVEALDSGKTLAEAEGDVLSSARLFQYYAGLADKIQGDTIPLTKSTLCMTMREPVGIVAHIVPWNYPTSTNIRGIAPTLAAGCTAIVKPAETTPLTALLFADILKEAGLPDGVYNVVTGTGKEAGAPLVSHPKIDHVTFTGSVATGIDVAKNVAPNVTSLTLELGGKSPLIALNDCNIDEAVEGAYWAIFSNSGQICSAGSRLIVDRKIHAEFIEKLVAKTKKIKVGHGLKNPDMGAVNNPNQLQKIDHFIQDAKKRNLSILTGAHIISDEVNTGWFYAPTIIDDLKSNDPLVQEEIFGPVLAVQLSDSLEESLALANDSKYGLIAGIYTKDISNALFLAKNLDCGQVTVNDYWAGGPEVPFGGNKFSGYGREKGIEGMNAYLKTKSITVKI